MEKGTIGAAINAIDAIQNVCYVLNSQPGEDVRDAARRTVDEKNDMRRQRDEALARAEKEEELLKRIHAALLINLHGYGFENESLIKEVCDVFLGAGYDLSMKAFQDMVDGAGR